MTPQEMIDVISAFRDGKPVETNDGGPDWWPVLSPHFNFNRFAYRIKPPALRPHWPAIARVGNDIFLTDSLYVDVIEAMRAVNDSGGAVIRLATEYPPVMLP